MSLYMAVAIAGVVAIFMFVATLMMADVRSISARTALREVAFFVVTMALAPCIAAALHLRHFEVLATALLTFTFFWLFYNGQNARGMRAIHAFGILTALATMSGLTYVENHFAQHRTPILIAATIAIWVGIAAAVWADGVRRKRAQVRKRAATP